MILKPYIRQVLSSRLLHNVVQPRVPENVYTEDFFIRRVLRSIYECRKVCHLTAEKDLVEFGSHYRHLDKLAKDCERFKPSLVRLDGWGGRVDEIVTCESWKLLHDIASKEALVAIGHQHDIKLKEVHQTLKLILFGAVSGMVSCPLAMTDGAATSLERLLDNHKKCAEEDCDICSKEWKKELKETISHLTSTNPAEFWTSGQWMTERAGGSDVSNATETVAVKDDCGIIKLYGNKFYTSAIDCKVSLALAKYNGNLSLFLVHLPQEFDDTVRVEKLKDKLGTHQLPTAELTLNGLPATLLAHKGISNIIPMLQVTRLYNAISAASYLRYITTLAHSYAESRTAFGRALNQLPLHRKSLAELETTSRALVLQSVDLALLFRNSEVPSTVPRVLSAVVKVHTARVAVSAIREGLESFGGAGYMEDTGLPGVFRDACVLPIWEGTSNVLAVETSRALARGSDDVMQYLTCLAKGTCWLGGGSSSLESTAKELEEPVNTLQDYLSQLHSFMNSNDKYGGLGITMGLGGAHAASVLINHALTTQDPSDIAAAKMWCEIGLHPLNVFSENDIDNLL